MSRRTDLPELLGRAAGVNDEPAVIAVVMPVFNQAGRIREHVSALASCLTLPHELILIDDGSDDGSEECLLDELAGLPDPVGSRCSASVYRFRQSRFETACDVAGIRLSDTPYVIEVQADMILWEVGFDARMLAAMRTHHDLLMLSGRGTEPVLPIQRDYERVIAHFGSTLGLARTAVRRAGRLLRRTEVGRGSVAPDSEAEGTSLLDDIFPDADRFKVTSIAGRLGPLIEVPLDRTRAQTNMIWVGETVMRGPLIIDRSKYQRVGGFDADRFFLGFDEHDLAMRGLDGFGYRCGFIPVGFDSPLALGSTRRTRPVSARIQRILGQIKVARRASGSSLSRADQIISSRKPPPEVRSFSV